METAGARHFCSEPYFRCHVWFVMMSSIALNGPQLCSLNRLRTWKVVEMACAAMIRGPGAHDCVLSRVFR